MTTTRPTLTPAQLRVLRLVAEGHSNPQIARLLWLSVNTIKTHIVDIRRTLGARDKTHAVHLAHLAGLLGDDTLGGDL